MQRTGPHHKAPELQKRPGVVLTRAQGRRPDFQPPSCASMGNEWNFSEPQFPHLSNGVNTGTHTTVCQGLHGEYFRLGSQTWSHHSPPWLGMAPRNHLPSLGAPEQGVYRTLSHGGCCSIGFTGARWRLKDSNVLAFWLPGQRAHKHSGGVKW